MSASEKTAAVSTLPLLLPPDILVEILSKLPAKSLVRFKCVSKFFYALMADHGFAVQHRNWSLTDSRRAGVLISIGRRTPRAYYTINLSEEEEENWGKLQAKRVGYLDGEPLRSSSDGLICLSKPNGDLTVCNVSTGQNISLPIIQFHSSFLTCAMLGFDSESKRYKALMSAAIVNPHSSSKRNYFKYKHWVLTVGVDKSWREITNNGSHLFYPYDGYCCPNYSHTSVYIDGVIYSYNWMSIDIIAFEVGSESFSVIPLPYEVPDAIGLGIYHYYEVLKNSALLKVDEGRLAAYATWMFGLIGRNLRNAAGRRLL